MVGLFHKASQQTALFINSIGRGHVLLFVFIIPLFYFWLSWVFIDALGLSLVAQRAGATLLVVHKILIMVASLVVKQGLQAHGLQQLKHADSVVVVHGIQLPTACGIFSNQRLSLCPLPWQVDFFYISVSIYLYLFSYLAALGHQGSNLGPLPREPGLLSTGPQGSPCPSFLWTESSFFRYPTFLHMAHFCSWPVMVISSSLPVVGLVIGIMKVRPLRYEGKHGRAILGKVS